MKAINLLNKIELGEPLPEIIGVDGYKFEYNEEYDDYYSDSMSIYLLDYLMRENFNLKELLQKEVILCYEPSGRIDKEIKYYELEFGESQQVLISEINMNFRNIREKLEEIVDEINNIKGGD